MKRTILAGIICITLIIAILCFCVGCDKTEVDRKTSSEKSMFVIVEHTGTWKVVYHKDTKVMYVVSSAPKNYGKFTLLVDADGKPMIWEN